MTTFQEDILTGIPAVLPEPKPYDLNINHAPKRKDILSTEEKVLAIKNALRYFPKEQHEVLAAEFAQELKEYGETLVGRIEELEQAVWEKAGEQFNINSPKQLGEVLFEKMELFLRMLLYTKQLYLQT